MACEALFRQAFPKWWTTRDAATTLQQMDAFIEQLLDPNRYHSHLAQVHALSSSPVSSSPSATPLHHLCTTSAPTSAPPPHRLRTAPALPPQLESSTEAIRIAARDELGVKPRSHFARFYATSTLVSTAIPRGHGALPLDSAPG